MQVPRDAGPASGCSLGGFYREALDEDVADPQILLETLHRLQNFLHGRVIYHDAQLVEAGRLDHLDLGAGAVCLLRANSLQYPLTLSWPYFDDHTIHPLALLCVGLVRNQPLGHLPGADLKVSFSRLSFS